MKNRLIGVLLALSSAAAVPVWAAEPRQVYAAVRSYGRAIRATTFSDPSRTAVVVEAGDCYVGVYDRQQKFALDAAGHLTGPQLMCQVMRRNNGRQASFIDAGCAGTRVLAEGASPADFQPAFEHCGKIAMDALLSAAWRGYVTARAVDASGWSGKKVKSVDISVGADGKPAKRSGVAPAGLDSAGQALDGLGRSYDSAFGRPALERFAAETLWVYEGGGKSTALDVFQKAPWWGAAALAPQPAFRPEARPEKSGVVPLLR